MNDGWKDPAQELPEDNMLVLAVKQLKSGRRDYCLARCTTNYRYYDTEKREIVNGPYWTCGGSNNVIAWMPLPGIPGERMQA